MPTSLLSELGHAHWRYYCAWLELRIWASEHLTIQSTLPALHDTCLQGPSSSIRLVAGSHSGAGSWRAKALSTFGAQHLCTLMPHVSSMTHSEHLQYHPEGTSFAPSRELRQKATSRHRRGARQAPLSLTTSAPRRWRPSTPSTRRCGIGSSLGASATSCLLLLPKTAAAAASTFASKRLATLSFTVIRQRRLFSCTPRAWCLPWATAPRRRVGPAGQSKRPPQDHHPLSALASCTRLGSRIDIQRHRCVTPLTLSVAALARRTAYMPRGAAWSPRLGTQWPTCWPTSLVLLWACLVRLNGRCRL